MKPLAKYMCAVALTAVTGLLWAQSTSITSPHPAAIDGPSTPPAAALGSNTYTYLRCHYREYDDPSMTAARYEWAVDAANAWHKVQGYWYSDGITQWRNMFYTEASQAALELACTETLRSKGISAEVAMISAADTRASFNHTIWTQSMPNAPARTERMIVFGDSLSDTQNLFNAAQWRFPAPGSWFLGRFSNGPVWPEYLSRSLHLPTYNWAIGAAAADQMLVIPGFVQQVESWQAYMREAKNYDPQKSLFYLMIGANDLLKYGRTPAQSLASIEQGLNMLMDRGARKILVSNLPDVTRAPVFLIRKDAVKVAVDVATFNAGLSKLIQGLSTRRGIDIVLFDAHAFFGRVIDNPQAAGFAEANQSCLRIDTDSALNYLRGHDLRAGCDPERYVFWDQLHPTSAMHRQIGEAIKAATPSDWLP
jgi:thermolabile hemolysin